MCFPRSQVLPETDNVGSLTHFPHISLQSVSLSMSSYKFQ
uniref:Uncharacterized protein n=1 Tax=Trichinella nativa TaxID=6335 RepID=A0A0V1KH11_9BILA